MEQSLPAIRLKVTGFCNRSCNFCHEEGDMKFIDPVYPGKELYLCINTLIKKLRIKRLMLTGGEPTTHPRLLEIISNIEADEKSITTNGIKALSVHEWQDLVKAGLSKVTLSIHDASAEKFLSLETKPHNIAWAEKSLKAQKNNLANLCQVGIKVRVNTVAYGGYDSTIEVIDLLKKLQSKHPFEIRLLNDLTNITSSQRVINQICQTISAKEVRRIQRAGSSNVTRFYETEDGFMFSTKVSFPFFFEDVCSGCSLREECYEGFYGVRVESRQRQLYIRLCLYKNSPDVLIPWREFISSSLCSNLANFNLIQNQKP